MKLRTKRGAERRLLLEAMLWLGAARFAILAIPFRWTVRLFALEPGEAAGSPGESSAFEIAQRIGWALRVASSRSPWQSTCLAQALAGTGMLRSRRIPATLAMGVAKSAGQPGGLEAHAWLSCGGVVLTGDIGREKFSIVAQFTQGAKCGQLHA